MDDQGFLPGLDTAPTDDIQDVHFPEPQLPAYNTQKSHLEIFREISKAIPHNDYGLPKFIYRPDLIPDNLQSLSHHEQAQHLTAASVEILYHEGYPTFDNGLAVWNQMPTESEESYRLFVDYLNQGTTEGIRRLELLLDRSPHHPASAAAARPAGSTGANGDVLFSIQELNEFHTYYYWSMRSRAYDLFRVASDRKLRERRILATTDRHYLEAERLFTKVLAYFDRVNPETDEFEWIEELTPKVAIDMLEKLHKIQRVSVGLSAHGGVKPDENDVSPHAAAEVILRQIARQGSDPDAAGGRGGTDLEMLLNDPESAAIAQELIIKVGGHR